MNDIMIGYAHTPPTSLDTPTNNMIEMTMINTHPVIRSSAAASELNNTVLVHNIRYAWFEGKTSNTTLLSRRKTKLKQTRLCCISRRIVQNDGIVAYSWTRGTSSGNRGLTFNCNADRHIYPACPCCRAARQ